MIASSGKQVRHRLSRAGNRRINHALHMMAVTQIRQPNSPGRGYHERKRLDDTGRNTVIAPAPEGTNATAILDRKDGRLVGIEILDASERLHPDLLNEAEDITSG